MFDPKTIITVGVEFFRKEYKEYNVISQFWDLGGVQRFDFLRPSYYKGADSTIIVCDLTRTQTFEEINYFLSLAKNHANLDPENHMILVGNKADLYDHGTINPSFVNLYAEEHDLVDFIETSARYQDNIDVVFEFATVMGMYNKGLISKIEFKSLKEELEERIVSNIFDPNEFSTKKCWNCKRILHFCEFSSSNSGLNRERLINLWESPYIQLYCCSCYKERNR